MRLSQAIFRNFMGTKDFAINCGGKSFSIHGKNEAGKTSVASGIYWVLFGTDYSFDSTFDFLPVDKASGEIIDCECLVELTFDDSTTLKKTASPKLTKKRNRLDKVLTGINYGYWFNGESLGAKEFQAACSNLVGDTQTFKMLSNPWFFAEELHWEERKHIAMHLVSDSLPENPLEIKSILAGRTIDETIESLEAELKRLKKENTFEAQIKALQSKIKGLELKSTDEIDQKIFTARQNLASATTGDGSETLRAERNTLDDKINQLKSELNILKIADDLKRKLFQDEVDMIKRHNECVKNSRRIADETIKGLCAQRENIQKQIESLRDEYSRITSNPDTKCSACGADLAIDKIEAAIVNHVELINDAGRKLSAEIASLDERIKQAELEKSLMVFDTEITGSHVTDIKIAEKMAEIAAVEKQKSEITNRISAILETGKADRDRISDEIRSLESELKIIHEHNAAVKMEEEIKADIIRLHGEFKSACQKTEAVDNDITLLEDYKRSLIASQSGAISEKFNGVRFKFSHRNFSGTEKDCFDIQGDNGVRWSGCSHSQRTNLGMRLISGLSKNLYHGKTLPVIIDYSGEFSDLIIPEGIQVIRLVVDPACPELTVKINE
jgi:DNA repair exonuclease SbcCD ATPase subunit